MDIRSGILQLYRRLDAWTARRARLLLVAGAIISLWFAISTGMLTAYVPLSGVNYELYGHKEDIHNLYYASANASWRDIPKWWIGSWIYPDVRYYRPVTSMLYFFEYRAFGRNFTGYNITSVVFHAASSLFLYLLVCSLFENRPRFRILAGLTAAYWFSSPINSMLFGVTRALGWWPAQNDVLSLTFGLLCLLLLDRGLVTGSRRLFVGSLFALAASIGSKEMGFCIAPMMLVLIWHRRRSLARELIAPTAVTAAIWIFRRIAVPNPWEPVMMRWQIVRKGMMNWLGPIWPLLATGDWWRLAAAAAVTAAVSIGLWRRWPVYVISVVGLIGAALCAQFIDPEGSFALLFESSAFDSIRSVLIYVLGLALFWRYRRTEPGIFAAATLFFSFLPILQYGGQHYFYWPAAFLSLVNAVFFVCLIDWAIELRENANWTLPDTILPFLNRSLPAKDSSDASV